MKNFTHYLDYQNIFAYDYLRVFVPGIRKLSTQVFKIDIKGVDFYTIHICNWINMHGLRCYYYFCVAIMRCCLDLS